MKFGTLITAIQRSKAPILIELSKAERHFGQGSPEETELQRQKAWFWWAVGRQEYGLLADKWDGDTERPTSLVSKTAGHGDADGVLLPAPQDAIMACLCISVTVSPSASERFDNNYAVCASGGCTSRLEDPEYQ